MTKPSTVTELRKQFIEFFEADERQQHVHWKASPVVPLDDPTLLFINAGMNQFKPIFLGTAGGTVMEDLSKTGRATNSQKCIRAGGKHNDLDDVGKDTYHHTFFEMLGNWSFGPYFKKEAISWAWMFLTEKLGLPQERLYVTYFEGNDALGVPPDTDAKKFWIEQGVPENRILPFGMKDNFWEMGETGPCGPCSEIHYDKIGGRDAAHLVNMDNEDVIEVWNLVFMQFNREGPTELRPLPRGCVDTGAGLERLASICQGKKSNYDIDLFQKIFKKIQEVTGCKEQYKETTDGYSKDDISVAYRVVADHIRTLTFAIVDGAAPSKDGRGFVLRRIIRRAIRYGKEYLHAPQGFFSQLVDVIPEVMGDYFPEVADPTNIKKVKAILSKEEALFARTYQQGVTHYKKMINNNQLGGEDAFILHSRWGFPIDLTLLMAEKDGVKVDHEAFQVAYKKHQEEAGGDDSMKAKKGLLGVHELNELENVRNVVTTDEDAKFLWEDCSGCQVVSLFDPKTKTFVAEYTGSSILVILEKTGFYSEGGGQVSDQGSLLLADGTRVRVDEAQNLGGYIVHNCSTEKKGQTVTIKEGDSVTCCVDYSKRLDTASNHTMTHCLNYSLRKVLVTQAKEEVFDNVDQKGSLVNEQMLRFDFSWPSKLSEEEVKAVEEDVNRQINGKLAIDSLEVEKYKADNISSLRSVFGERYPPSVRVVSVGAPVEDMIADPTNKKWLDYSVEFCGGTHLKNTEQAECAVVVAEQALGGNIRRMVMFTRGGAKKAQMEATDFSNKLDDLLKKGDSPDAILKELNRLGKAVDDAQIPLLSKVQLRERVKSSHEDVSKKQKEHLDKMKAIGKDIGEKIEQELTESKSNYVVKCMNDYNDTLKGERDALNEALKVLDKANVPVMLIIKGDATSNITCNVPKDVVGKLNAVEWLKSVCKGGGKPFSAQGAGLPNDGVKAAMEVASKFATEKLA